MKYSQFNSVIPYRDRYALYNAFEDKVVFLEPDLKELLFAAQREGVTELESIHPTFYQYLATHRFLVRDDADEVEAVKRISKAVDENPAHFHLTVNPTMNCNFKCWYCYETHIKSSRLEADVIDKIKRLISKRLAEKELKHFTLALFGGEPLLYFEKNVVPIIEHLVPECRQYDKSYNVGFTTNGYLINSKFVDYFLSRDIKCHFQITLDGYRATHDQVRFVSRTRGSYFKILDNIKQLIKNRFYVRLRINYTDKNLADTYKIAEDMEDVAPDIIKEYLLIDYHRVWQNQKADDLDRVLNKNMAILRSKGFQVQGNFAPNNVQNSCYADKRNSVVVNYNGDIYKCTARDFKSENRVGYIADTGDLIWLDDHLERRMHAKFKNPPCLSCRLLPICNGGCSQHALENLDNEEGYCIYSFDEGQKDKVVRAKVDEIIEKR